MSIKTNCTLKDRIIAEVIIINHNNKSNNYYKTFAVFFLLAQIVGLDYIMLATSF